MSVFVKSRIALTGGSGISAAGLYHQHMATKKQEEATKQVLASAMIAYEKRSGFYGLGKFLEERGTIILIPDEPE